MFKVNNKNIRTTSEGLKLRIRNLTVEKWSYFNEATSSPMSKVKLCQTLSIYTSIQGCLCVHLMNSYNTICTAFLNITVSSQQ